MFITFLNVFIPFVRFLFSQINEVLNGLFFNESIVNRIANQFETEMNLALNERFDESSVLMENTYIPELPDGTGSLIVPNYPENKISAHF